MTRYTTHAPIGEFELAEGDVETEIQIAKVGEYEHASFGRFAITPQHCEEMARNYERELSVGHKRMVTIGHPARLDGAPAAGWLESVRATPDGLFARVRLLADTAKRVKAGEYSYFSPTFTSAGKDESGRAIGARLLSGAITNDPFLKGMRPFELSAAAEETDDMNENEVKALVASETASLTAKLSEAEGTIKTLSEQVQERDARILELAAQVQAHEAKATAAEVARVVDDAVNAGKLSIALRDSLLPGVADDPIKALAASPFRDAKALADYLSKAPVVVDLGERKSADAGDPVSLSAPNAADLETLSRKSGVPVEALKRAADLIASRN